MLQYNLSCNYSLLIWLYLANTLTILLHVCESAVHHKNDRNVSDVSCIIAKADYNQYVFGSKHDTNVASKYSAEKYHQLLLDKYAG